MKNWLKDPLIAFLGLGAALFAAAILLEGDATDRVINVDAAEMNRLTQQWNAQMGRQPTAEEMEGLIESFIQEEIYFREALRLSLDQGDIIVRRRLVQKLNFL
ncbi:MAG: peptidyl-prolyl cis-trans isomerase, partial [Gammaproteobacteria bacterium]|nr:peptidyl-prolyl cis-trans isomerase [Gammaproteobacteria bacterium]